MPKHTAKERKKTLARQEKITSDKVKRKVAGERHQRAHDRASRKAGLTPFTSDITKERTTPGEKARIRNLKRHGKQVPVVVGGKIENRVFGKPDIIRKATAKEEARFKRNRERKKRELAKGKRKKVKET